MTISLKTYEQVALEDGDDQWELVCGTLRKKPGMTIERNDVLMNLARQLLLHFDPDEYRVRANTGRVHIETTVSYYVPDVFVLPRSLVQRARAERSHCLEMYDDPLPLVVEVWSPSTGNYDVETKLREYQHRGDAEIWRIHPYEHTLTAWRRQPDGSYSQTLAQSGTVQPVALPGVTIDLDMLFE